MTKNPRKSKTIPQRQGELIAVFETGKELALEPSFVEVVALIRRCQDQTWRAVNVALVALYWQIGEYISRKLETSAWGEGVVDQLAAFIAREHPDLKGFTRPNLFRMRQLYETYRNDEKVSPLVRQLPWTHNLLILSRCKRPEEREFYLSLCIRQRWGKRELERQLASALFERSVLSPPNVSPSVTQLHPEAASVFKDSYVLDFLDLPEVHSEHDLQRALVPTQLTAEYLLLLMLSPPFTKYTVDCSMRVAMPKINREALGECWLWFPSLEEQQRIVTWVKEQTGAYFHATQRIQDELGLMLEYRTRLIADVVTGKLDVREAAARLPDEGDADGEIGDDLLEDDEPVDDAELNADAEEVEARIRRNLHDWSAAWPLCRGNPNGSS